VATVSRLSIAPVKGLGLVHPDEVALERTGVVENRRFHIVGADGRRFNQIRHGPLVRIRPDYDAERGRLALRFPDGEVVEGEIALGEAVTTDFYGRAVEGHVVEGPWAEVLSAYAGRPLRLVRADRPGDAVDRAGGSVSMISEASLEELARRAGTERIDGRRFRMLFELAGCAPHEEDEWLGGHVRVGEALVRLDGQVGRCAITTQNPDTGVPDLDTLRAIKSYRGLRDGEAIDFGVYGVVVEPGRVRLGDPVELRAGARRVAGARPREAAPTARRTRRTDGTKA